MKTYLLVLFVACQSCAALAQDWNKTPFQTRSLASDDIKNVNVQTSGGSITVSGAQGEPARVEVYVNGNNGNNDLSKEELQKRLDEDYTLDISVSDHQLHAVAKRKHDGFNWNWKKQLNISFKVYVPKQVDTHLSTSGGSIHLDNLTGEEDFSTSGGSLHLDALTGTIKGETSGGSIDVSNSGDKIDLGTSGGSIHASNLKGKIRLETSGGSLHLQDLKGNIDANTSGGSIQATNVEGEFKTGTSGGSVHLSQMACSLDASTSGGSMEVEMLSVGKYVKLDVSGGHVNLKLPSKVGLDLNLSADKINSNMVTNFTGEWEKTHVKGSVDGGGVPVHVDASGNLNVSFN